jgi:hypothetical protein
MMPLDATRAHWQPFVAACRWVEHRLGDFTISRGSRDAFWASLKAVAELAHAADFLRRMPDAAWHATGDRWLDHAWREVGHGEVIVEVIAKEARFLPVALTFVPFHLAGLRAQRVLDAIAAQLPRAELVPLEWTFVLPALAILELPVPSRPMQSVLVRRTPAAELSLDDTYTLAHECFYVARWGHASPSIDAETAAYVADVLPALVERFRGAGDADVLAELVLASRTCGVAVAAGASEAIAAAQAPEGNVVPPARLVSEHRRFVHATMSRTYHTTLAAIMAWAS